MRYRKSLWAEDIEPEEEATREERVVPDFYHKHNGRCGRCALPLVPGLNQRLVRDKGAKRGKPRAKSKRTFECTLCHHEIRL